MTLHLDPIVEAYLTDTSTAVTDWVDLTSRVTSPDGTFGIEVQNGSLGGGDSIPEPCSMRVLCKNNDSYLTPDNPMSPYYESLDLNTPIRYSLGLDSDTFTRTTVNGWGSTSELGQAYTNTGGGGSVLTSDWAVAGGVGTHSVPTTVAYRQSVLGGISQVDAVQYIDFQLPTSNVTGGTLEPANLICRSNATGQVLLRLRVKTDESITAQYLFIASGGSETALTSETTSPRTNSGQWMRVMASVENCQYRAKLWNRGDPEPLVWLIDAQFDSEATFTVATGNVGVRTGVATGNTNAKPVIVSYDNYRILHPRFSGYMSTITPAPTDPSLNVILTEIMAFGKLQQILTGESPVTSTLRGSIPAQIGLAAYWPMEDGSEATQFASAFPGAPPMAIIDGTPSAAAYSTLASSKPIAVLNNAVLAGEVPEYPDTHEWQVRFFCVLPAGGSQDGDIICRVYTEVVGAWMWQLLYHTSGDLELQVLSDEATVVHTSTTANFDLDGVPARLSIGLTQDGSDIDYEIVVYRVGATSATVNSGTFTTMTLGTAKRVFFNNNWNVTRLDQVAIGHVTVQSIITSIFDVMDETNAYNGERTFTRLQRVAYQDGFSANVQPGRDAHLYMGPQKPATVPDVIRQCVEVGMGFLFEARGAPALSYREITALYSRAFVVAADFNQLRMNWAPITDPRDVRNKWTVSRTDGSEAVFEKETGRRSTLSPGDGGVGTYASSITLNARDDGLLRDQAAVRVSQGTATGARFESLMFDRAQPNVTADTVLCAQLLDARPGDRIEAADPSAAGLYDTIRQITTGYREKVSGFQHRLEYSTRPHDPYDALKLESSTTGRLDAKSCVLDANSGTVTTGATTLRVVSTSDWWTVAGAQVPFDILIGGERMTVTAVSDPVPSFVAVGTAAHADNGSVTPGLPGGTTTTGDALLIFDCARDFGANGVIPTGYVPVLSLFDQVQVWGKYHSGSESAPTITLTGGSAGVTHSAQIASFRNMSLTVLASSVSDNGSAQNIAFLGVASIAYKAMALYLGHKADDCTSVATVTGATEIAEATTTTGNDQTLVWDYRALTSPVGVGSGSFVVTGGAAAFSEAFTALMAVPQVLTVTRSVNHVVKTHPAGAEVHVYRPARLAL